MSSKRQLLGKENHTGSTVVKLAKPHRQDLDSEKSTSKKFGRKRNLWKSISCENCESFKKESAYEMNFVDEKNILYTYSFKIIQTLCFSSSTRPTRDLWHQLPQIFYLNSWIYLISQNLLYFYNLLQFLIRTHYMVLHPAGPFTRPKRKFILPDVFY